MDSVLSAFQPQNPLLPTSKSSNIALMQAQAGKFPLLAAHLDLMSAEQWKGLLVCLLYAGTSTAISMVNKVGGCACGVCVVWQGFRGFGL